MGKVPSKGQALPKRIWMLWLQGVQAAPPLVSACVASWVDRNPDWDVVLLSRATLKDHIDPSFLDEVFGLELPVQKTANLLRLYLISHHGGVWADATCYCAVPLDEWLPEHMGVGFFAFRFDADAWLASHAEDRVGRITGRSGNRIMSNWFLAGVAHNPICKKFLKLHFDWFKRNRFGRKTMQRVLRPVVMRTMVRNAWLGAKLSNDRVVRLIQGFPYHIFHYHFASMLLDDPDLYALWKSVRGLPSRDALAYSRSLHLPVDEEFQKAIHGSVSPVYKFHWDKTEGSEDPTTRIGYLLGLHRQSAIKGVFDE